MCVCQGGMLYLQCCLQVDRQLLSELPTSIQQNIKLGPGFMATQLDIVANKNGLKFGE